MNNNGSSFFSGLVVGVVAGAVAGILLAPKSGAETRAELRAAAKKLEKDIEHTYNEAKDALDRKVAALKKAGKKIDTAKYKELVDSVVSEMADTKDLTAEEAKALGAQLRSDSSKVAKALQA